MKGDRVKSAGNKKDITSKGFQEKIIWSKDKKISWNYKGISKKNLNNFLNVIVKWIHRLWNYSMHHISNSRWMGLKLVIESDCFLPPCLSVCQSQTSSLLKQSEFTRRGKVKINTYPGEFLYIKGSSLDERES